MRSFLRGLLSCSSLPLLLASCGPEEATLPSPDAGHVGVWAPDASLSPPSPSVRPRDLRVLGWFEGFADPEHGTFELYIRTAPEGASDEEIERLRVSESGLCDEADYVVVQDGNPGVGPADSIEVVTPAATIAQDAACYPLWNPLFDPPLFCADVTVRSFYTALTLEGVFAEVESMSDINHLGWQDDAEPDPGNPPSGVWGLWSYGDLLPVGSAPANEGTERWIFERNNDTFYSFQGRIVGAAVDDCDAYDNDCDGLTDEDPPDNDPLHCGACFDACSTNNGSPSCAAGTCSIACDPGWDDCNLDARADGCEVDVNATVAHCGACGDACSSNNGSPSCALGSCSIACSGSFGDCDADPRSNGCETDTDADALNCGSCGAPCAVPYGCSGGICEDCADGIQNGDESGVDCGGTWCGPCPCGTHQECMPAAACVGGFCAAAVVVDTSLVIPAGLSQPMAGTLNFPGDVLIAGTAEVTEYDGSTPGTGTATFSIGGELHIYSGGLIDGHGAGYRDVPLCGGGGPDSEGPGGGKHVYTPLCGGSFLGSGGGHGGLGQAPTNDPGTNTGSAYGTAGGLSGDMGSGGGSGNCWAGGDGGGSVRAFVTGAVLIEGTIDVAGEDGSAGCSAGGGGSAGTVLVAGDTVTLAPGSSVVATGGDGATGTAGRSGCGGGGRVKLYGYSAVPTALGSISVSAGDGSGNPNTTGDGTLVICLDALGDGVCD